MACPSRKDRGRRYVPGSPCNHDYSHLRRKADGEKHWGNQNQKLLLADCWGSEIGVQACGTNSTTLFSAARAVQSSQKLWWDAWWGLCYCCLTWWREVVMEGSQSLGRCGDFAANGDRWVAYCLAISALRSWFTKCSQFIFISWK